MTDSSIYKKIIKELFTLLEVEIDELKLKVETDLLQINIKSPESALIIGRFGETIQDLQTIIAMMIFGKTSKWVKVSVDINNWREEREKYLQQMAINLAQKVKFSGKEAILPPLSAFERRIIHVYLNDYPDVETYSQGEGRTRRLIIKPKPSV